MATVSSRNTRKRSLRKLIESLDSDLDSSSSASDFEPEYEVEQPSASPKALNSAQNTLRNGKRAPKNGPRPLKVPRNTSTTLQDVTQDVPLFRALSDKELPVDELALEWTQAYSQNACNAMTGLFNFLLRTCGCKSLAQNHDMLNDDSASATVTEVSLMFQRQKYHEYPFISNNKEIRFFRRNVLEFFAQIVRVGHENGALYKKETQDSSLASPMMNSLLAWLTALSTCTVRPFRYVSTTILLEMQTALCELAASVTLSLEKQRRLLAALNKARKNARRIDVVNNSIRSYSTQKDTLSEYMSDIFLSMFVHRYRDVDVAVRVECAKYLGDWMLIYSDVFLQAEYLRYLGWLLSDPSDSVKEEVIKLLHKLYKNTTLRRDTMGSGYRQFTERFKKQLINMIWVEGNANVKAHLFGVYQEMFKLGFMDTDDCKEICLFAFYLVETGLLGGSSKARVEACKFISSIAAERGLQEMERFSLFLSSNECPLFDEENLSISSCLNFKILAELLETSYAHYVDVKRPSVVQQPSEIPLQFLVNRLFSTIYTFPYYQNTWESLVLYILCDLSSVNFKPKDDGEESPLIEEELKTRLEFLLLALKYLALSMISGAIMSILTKDKKGASNIDDFNYALPKLATYFSSLEEFLSSSPRVYAVFMSLWNSVLITIPGHIAKLYTNVSSINDYNFVHEKVLRYYADMDSGDTELNETFDLYLQNLLQNFDSENSGENQYLRDDRILTTEVSVKVEDLLLSLVTEATEDLLLSEPIEDTNDSEENTMLPFDQKVVLNRLFNVKSPLQKLNQISRSTNINRFVTEPFSGSSKILLEVLVVKLLSKANMSTLVQLWPSNLSTVIDPVTEAWTTVYKFLLTTLSWKLEDLTFASNDSSSIDVTLFLGDFVEVVTGGSALCIQLCDSVKELNEITSDSNTRMRLLLEQLVQFKHKLSLDLLDILVSIRVFYNKFSVGNSFKNFEQLFINSALRDYVTGTLPDDLQKALMDVYLIEEARLAHKCNATLERVSGEDVNYEDYVFEPQDNSQDWDDEKELCIYTVKLFSLQRSGALGDDITGRMELNCAKLGPLYREIVHQNIHKEEEPNERDPQEGVDH